MSLKYVASYLLAVVCGTESPSKKDIEAILGSVGSEVDEEALDGFLSAIAGKTVHEAISSGLSKLQTVPTGGVAVAAATAGAPAADATDAGKKEEPEAEEEEEDMGFSLFD